LIKDIKDEYVAANSQLGVINMIGEVGSAGNPSLVGKDALLELVS
jgi:hypothetical protein